MGELKNRADSLERNIVLIGRELDEQKKKVEGLAGEIKYIAEKAERLEDENEKLEKALGDQQKEYEKKIAELSKQK